MIDIDLEPNKDFIHIRDGSDPSDPLLAKMTGNVNDNPKFILSTTNQVYIYFHSSFGDSRRGFAIRFRAGSFFCYLFTWLFIMPPLSIIYKTKTYCGTFS